MNSNSGLKHFYSEYYRPYSIGLIVYNKVKIYKLVSNYCFKYSSKKLERSIRNIFCDPDKCLVIDMSSYNFYYELK